MICPRTVTKVCLFPEHGLSDAAESVGPSTPQGVSGKGTGSRVKSFVPELR